MLEREYHFTKDVLADPTPAQLTAMLAVLPPPIARCALYGLLTAEAGDPPIAAMAAEHQDELRVAADRQPPRDAREVGRAFAAEADSDVIDGSADESEGAGMLPTSEEALEALKTLGGQLASMLRPAADQVEAGRVVSRPEDLAASVAAWCAAREDLARRLSTVGCAWPADQGYAEIEAELKRLADNRAERLATLRRKAQSYVDLLDMAEGEEEAASLRGLLESVQGEIAGLEAAVVSQEAGAEKPTPPEPTHGGASAQDWAAEDAGEVDGSEVSGTDGGLRAEPPEAENLSSEADAEAAALTEIGGEDARPAGAAEVQPPTALAVGRGAEIDVTDCPIEEEQGSEAFEVRPSAESGDIADGAPTGAPSTLGLETEPAEGWWPDGIGKPDWDPRAPWETGESSPVARLMRDGRMAEAYWMTAASDEPASRSQALAFTVAAYACISVADATPVQIAHDFDSDLAAQDREAYLVALAAALRTGLTARWAHPLVSGFSMPSGLTAPWQELLNVLVAAVRNGRTFVPGALQADEGQQEHSSREEIGKTARRLLDDLPHRKTQYQRASQVLKYLLGPSGRLREALNSVIQWAEQGGGGADFRALGDQLLREGAVRSLIEETDAQFRTPKQAKEPITAGAFRQLLGICRVVGEIVMKAEAASAASRPVLGSEPGVTGLAAALRELRGEGPLPGVGGAALGVLRGWLSGDLPNREGGAERLRVDGGTIPPDDCLLGLPDLPRDASGRPTLGDPRTARLMAGLLGSADVETALSRYTELGDLHLAKALVMAVEKDPSAYGSPHPEWVEGAARRCAQSYDDWRRRLADKHRSAAGLLAEIRTLNLNLAPDIERDFTGRLQEFADGEESGRYRLALDSLEGLETELKALVNESTNRLRQDLARLRTDPDIQLTVEDHERIARLIEEGDTVTAQEFLALATSRQALPERPEDDGSELAEFVAGLVGPGVPKAGGDGVDATWWADRFGAADDASRTQAARAGLESWKALCTQPGRTSHWQQHILQVLRLLGLEMTSSQLNSEQLMRGHGMRRFRAKARVAERPGYVAALGSRATSYTVMLVWEEQPADGPLAHLEDADVGANIVLYLHPLGVEGRRGLAVAARKNAQQALVVDPAVLGWMAVRAPGSFRSLQRVTLPWAAYNPYTPFVAGLVPQEVFYGRDKEMGEVMGRDSGMFLYGGRQLGKSALLRRVAEIFPSRREENVAVYLDLLKAEIGHAEAPEQIWSRLVEALKRENVFDNRMSDRAGPEIVVKRIREWLDADESRRLLVLADEADSFLNTDSRRAYKLGSESTFPNVMQFQRLMEQTERRFKIVFAGLHQVQRFGHLSNVSTVHGGPDVLVGPLMQAAAIRLVTEPMAALGYTFERPELVWRILAITNYQANLVQIFCRELVETLHARPYDFADGPVRITEADVQQVAASETVRRRIAERLRFTINLEDRYRVLALVIALRSLEDGYRGDYTPRELLQLAREAWPAGFEPLGVKQVQIFLTEMVGLGLLYQLGDHSRFAVRSPNVVNMLGTREELELELQETEFTLPYDYNPRSARRILGRDPQQIQRYSPLTEGQLHEAAQPGVSVVGVTELHRPGQVLKATEVFAQSRGVEVLKHVRGGDLGKTLRGQRKAHLLTADLRGASAEELRETLRSFVKHAGPAAEKLVPHAERRSGGKENRSVVVLADAAQVGEVLGGGQGEELSVRVLSPDRWTTDALRAWSECPFVAREDRARLVAATGGWPHWAEVAVADVAQHGATLDSALERIRLLIEKPTNVEHHLRQSGLAPRDLELAAAWTAYVEEGQGLPRDDVEAAVELSSTETESWLARLDHLGLLDETEGGFAVEPVTYRAIRSWASRER
ncbi:hypothetical protein AB0D45_13155 [Streptomyces sp. NPDC048352]|uniref:hypothetical protein n=1 Tax=Streptomyces sp. NPDC048352 TaxID=3154718 RepID=UPI00343B58D0